MFALGFLEIPKNRFLGYQENGLSDYQERTHDRRDVSLLYIASHIVHDAVTYITIDVVMPS